MPTLEQRELKFYKERVVPYSLEFTNYGRGTMLDRTNILQQGMGVKTTNRYYFHKNQLGSIIGLSNGSGDIVIEYGYDDYGKVFVKTGQGEYISIENYEGNDYSNVRLYTGREYNKELGRYYYRARMYSPELGRFTSIDPIGPKDDINMFTYVGNNPINRIDPMGLEKVLVMIGIDYNGVIPDLNNYDDTLWSGPIRKYVDRKGFKGLNNVDIRVVSNLMQFSHNMNEKQRKGVVLVGHGGPDSIYLNVNNPVKNVNIIDEDFLNNHYFSKDKSEKFSNTHLLLISCSTGKGDNPIAKKIQEHYGFAYTLAPNKDYISTTGEIIPWWVHSTSKMIGTKKFNKHFEGEFILFK